MAEAVETGNPEVALRKVWNTVQEVYVPEPKTVENATRVAEVILQRDGARGVMDRVEGGGFACLKAPKAALACFPDQFRRRAKTAFYFM